MRGKPVAVKYLDRYAGLIPACAGKTLNCENRWFTHRAHPRVCGENAEGNLALAQLEGSSPRVRGKPPTWIKDLTRLGLIPACAGKTLSYAPYPVCKRAHPRVCGENGIERSNDLFAEGSSPRVRGKH